MLSCEQLLYQEYLTRLRHSVLLSDIKASELPASQGPTASPGPFASKVPPYELDGSSRSGVH